MTKGLSIVEQLKMLQGWMPLLGYGQRYLAETDSHRRVLVIGDAMEWLTSKSQNRIDDQLVRRIVAILKTPEGEALVRDLVSLGDSLVAAQGMQGVES